MRTKARTRGSAIKEHRDRLRLNQAQLAARSGVDRRTISAAERGQRQLNLTEISLLAQTFGVADTELYDPAALPGPPPAVVA